MSATISWSSGLPIAIMLVDLGIVTVESGLDLLTHTQ